MSRTLHFILIAVLFAGCEARDGEQQRPNQSTNAGPTTMTTVDPKDILFSLSTLNDELPPVAGSAVEGDGHCRMHEDNWRQFEFVSASHHAEVAAELEAIEGIWKQYSVSVGEGMTAFREVHVRKRLPKPIDVPMSRAGFENLAGGPSRAMTFFDGKILQGVHAARLPGVIVYAVIWNDRMIALGLEPTDRFTIDGDAGDRLEQFITEHDLRLVHWPSRTLFKSPSSAMEYLRGKAD